MSPLLRIALSPLLLLGGASAGAPPAACKVEAIRAHLYFPETGEVDGRDVVHGQDLALWNTIIGEGSAGRPSSVTLVQVELSAPAFTGLPGDLKLTVTPVGGKRSTRSLPLASFFSEGPRLVVPFLLYDTGCQALDLVATVPGAPPVKGRVPFACGE